MQQNVLFQVQSSQMKKHQEKLLEQLKVKKDASEQKLMHMNHKRQVSSEVYGISSSSGKPTVYLLKLLCRVTNVDIERLLFLWLIMLWTSVVS